MSQKNPDAENDKSTRYRGKHVHFSAQAHFKGAADCTVKVIHDQMRGFLSDDEFGPHLTWRRPKRSYGRCLPLGLAPDLDQPAAATERLRERRPAIGDGSSLGRKARS